MTRLARFTTALVLVATAAACGGSSSDNSSLVSSTPTATVNTETFTGTVPANGTDGSHTSTVTTAGTVNITLTQAGPPPNIVVQLGIGTPGTGGACLIISGGSTLAQASTTAQLSGTVAAGTYCIAVAEFQGVGTITYTVTVAHT